MATKKSAGSKSKAVTKRVSTSTQVQTLLETIHAKEKWLVKGLLPPASADAKKILRALEVPSTMLALYEMHDGTEDEMFGPYQLLPVERIVEEQQVMNELLAANASWREKRNWDARWIPFLADGDGQYYCVDPAGSCDGGIAGQILFYDHEVGPQREFTSFDALVGLLTNLAKKKLLGLEAREENEDKFEELYSEAKAVGLPKMPPKELKAFLKKLEGDDDEELSAAQKLELLIPVVRKFSAEEDLWREVRQAAELVGDWSLLLEAATTAMRLASRGNKNSYTREVFLGLHKAGRDADALEELRAGLKRITSVNESRTSLVPHGIDPDLRQRALLLITEVFPKDRDTWFALGEEAATPSARATYFGKVIALIEEQGVSYYTAKIKYDAERRIEHDRIANLGPEERLEALIAFARKHTDEEDEDTNTETADAWETAAKCALELAHWSVLEETGAKALKYTDGYMRYKICHLHVRALHELGRDEEAITVLNEALGHAYTGSEDCFVAIPRHEDRRAGKLDRSPADAAFEAKCFALVTDRSPDNYEAWKWRRVFASGAERRAVLEHLVTYCTEEAPRTTDEGEPYYDTETIEDFRRVREECVAEIGRR